MKQLLNAFIEDICRIGLALLHLKTSHARQPTLIHNTTTSKQGQVKVVINEHIYVPSLDR